MKFNHTFIKPIFADNAFVQNLPTYQYNITSGCPCSEKKNAQMPPLEAYN
jgi:hypothetical protein